MKKTALKNLMALALVAGLFSSCGGDSNTPGTEKTGNTNTEDMVEGADGGLDSLDLPEDTTNTMGTTGGGGDH